MKTHDEMIRDLYARRDAYELQKQAQKRKIKRTAVRLSGIAACLVICLTVGLGMYQETKAPGIPSEQPAESFVTEPLVSEGESSDEEPSQTESSESSEQGEIDDHVGWDTGLQAPFAAVEVLRVTDETLCLDRENEYTKIDCKVLYTTRAKNLTDEGDANEYISQFETIYILSDTAKQLKKNNILFFEIESHLYRDQPYYSPKTYGTETVLLHLRSNLSNEMLEEGSENVDSSGIANPEMSSWNLLNGYVRLACDFLESNGLDASAQVLSDFRFEHGLYLEEVEEAFAAIDSACDLFREE